MEKNSNKKVAVIGGGISGLTVAHALSNYDVTVFEKESTPGGLIRCKLVEGSLYHICGGHIFNSKRQDVLEWFWNFFEQEEEFTKADRNSVVYFDSDTIIPYPIENHIYRFNEDIQKSFIKDLLAMTHSKNFIPHNFEEFLKNKFGDTLYNIYFKPYNKKVWRRDLTSIPLSWLEGKLPMPTIEEMIFNNINHVKEKSFVHSIFWYEKKNGSQYIADKLAEGLNINYNTEISEIIYKEKKWFINNEIFDKVIFCGNIKDLIKITKGIDLEQYSTSIEQLEFHGTTSVFCEIEENPYSWIYLPSQSHESHRIICTGNFSVSNNAAGKMTGTIEFTDYISQEDILKELKKIPFAKRYITHHYNKCTYPIQDNNTKELIRSLKAVLAKDNFYFTGRFADWEYYNMDVAIGAALDLCKNI